MPPLNNSESFRNALEVLSKSLVFTPITDEWNSKTEKSEMEDSASQSSSRFHELYLQRQGMEFAMPILFEDGMDYIECELYYAAHSSTPSPSRRLSKLQQQQQRQLLLSSATSPVRISRKSPTTPKRKFPLPSCLRRRRSSSSMSTNSNHSATSTTAGYSESESSMYEDDPFSGLDNGSNHSTGSSNNNNQHHHTPPTRRCSFAGMPVLPQTTPPELSPARPSHLFKRSQSWDDLDIRGVGFQEYVQVVTIHSAMDYPPDVRKNLWMSRRELSQSLRKALAAGMVRRKDGR